MLLYSPVLVSPGHVTLPAPVCCAPPPPPRRRPLLLRRRIRVLVGASLLALFLPHFLPEQEKPALYKDGLDAEVRSERDRARRVRRALYGQ